MSQTEDGGHDIVPDGKEAYGIVINQEGKLYLEFSKESGLKAYNSIQEARDVFAPFVDKLRSQDYETHTSGGLGLNMLRPKVIKFPRVAKDLTPYLISTNTYDLVGQGYGYFIRMKEAEVKESITDLVVFDIAYEAIINNN